MRAGGRQKSHFFAGCCQIDRASSEAVAGSGIRVSGCVGRKGHRLKRQRKPFAPGGRPNAVRAGGRQKSHFFAGCCQIDRASSEAVAGSGIRVSGCVGRKGHRLKRQRKPFAPGGRPNAVRAGGRQKSHFFAGMQKK